MFQKGFAVSEFLSPEKRQLLAKALSTAGHQKTPTIARRNSDDPAPLSFAQQRIWFIQQLNPDNPQYNTPVGVSLKGPLNIPALERTLTEIVRRQEVFRTIFRTIDGQPAQVVLPAFDLRLTIRDLSEHPSTDRQAVAQRIIDEESARPFDFDAGRLHALDRRIPARRRGDTDPGGQGAREIARRHVALQARAGRGKGHRAGRALDQQAAGELPEGVRAVLQA